LAGICCGCRDCLNRCARSVASNFKLRHYPRFSPQASTAYPHFDWGHDLRANAFRVCREGKPLNTFSDHALVNSAR
jgi:hypothetical protein